MEFFPKNYDSFKVFLFKKVERISLALYLATNHISDGVSLKTHIREIADCLIKDILEFNRGQTNINSTITIKEDFLELKTLINFAMSANLINRNNSAILIEEINKLSRDIDTHKDNLIGDSDFKKSFFVVESRPRFSEPVSEANSFKGHEEKIETKEVATNVRSISNFNKGQEPKNLSNSRAEEIMKIIKDNGKVTIKDISNQIKNCSEKTIQRELLKMVSLNLIKKEGERRWSTYSIL